MIVIPETQTQEKIDLLRTLGAEVRTVAAVPYKDPGNYQKVAARLAEETDNAVFANQFDNTANRDGHYLTTGPEIWRQSGGQIDAFVAATGTGGTLAGVARYLKEQHEGAHIALADPAGSALFHYFRDGALRPSEGGSITEGIGTSRLTRNLEGTQVDQALYIPDTETVPMVYRLLREEGLYLGSSSGVNVVAAARVARELGPGHTVITILCDGGARYYSRLYNREWLAHKGFAPSN